MFLRKNSKLRKEIRVNLDLDLTPPPRKGKNFDVLDNFWLIPNNCSDFSEMFSVISRSKRTEEQQQLCNMS